MPLLVAALIIVPLIEIFVIIQVGQLVGPWWTIALLVLSSVIGAVLMKREGSKAWRRFTSALNRGKVPAKETADGGLVIFGGALLLTPGFVTDLAGLLMLIPGTRDIVRRFMVARAIDIGVGGMGRPVVWGGEPDCGAPAFCEPGGAGFGGRQVRTSGGAGATGQFLCAVACAAGEAWHGGSDQSVAGCRPDG